MAAQDPTSTCENPCEEPCTLYSVKRFALTSSLNYWSWQDTVFACIEQTEHARWSFAAEELAQLAERAKQGSDNSRRRIHFIIASQICRIVVGAKLVGGDLQSNVEDRLRPLIETAGDILQTGQKQSLDLIIMNSLQLALSYGTMSAWANKAASWPAATGTGLL